MLHGLKGNIIYICMKCITFFRAFSLTHVFAEIHVYILRTKRTPKRLSSKDRNTSFSAVMLFFLYKSWGRRG